MTAFLDRVPDRERATAAVAALAERLRADPMHGPLVFAPRPDSIVRAAFEPRVDRGGARRARRRAAG